MSDCSEREGCECNAHKPQPDLPDAKDIVERLRAYNQRHESSVVLEAINTITTLRSERDAAVKEKDEAQARYKTQCAGTKSRMEQIQSLQAALSRPPHEQGEVG